MVAVHVPVELLLGGALVVDVCGLCIKKGNDRVVLSMLTSVEGTTRGFLVAGGRDNHVDAHAVARNTMNIVFNVANLISDKFDQEAKSLCWLTLE